MRMLGLINARGGSKGIPNKNIRPLGGKPLLAWSVDVARQCRSLATVVVSTDSDAIAAAATAVGARVPFMRPAHLAGDTALQIDAVRHAIDELEKRGERYDGIVILQPVAPFRTVDDVEGAISLFTTSGADSVISVMEVKGQHPATMYKMEADNLVTPLMAANTAGILRQQLPKIYWRTGSIYIVKRDVVVNRRSLYGDDVRGYVVPEERSINLDTLFDWSFAEFYLQRRAAQGDPDVHAAHS
jgi:N-acylneuraminate cytidylyltransferase